MIPRIGLRAVLGAAVALALASASAATAQQRGTVTGAVLDQATQQPVVGAQVVVTGTQLGTRTDQQGRFQLSNVPSGSIELQASMLGYTAVTHTVAVPAGGSATADFQLSASVVAVEGLVVTALGVERQAKELAYSTSEVSGEELTRAPETNFVTGLASRTPGVNVVTQSGNVGGSTRIVIRGINSLSGDNQPLFVVDGVPISNANTVTGTSQDRLNGAIDVGNRGADISAEDIASVTVLKGAAAAALYGQRAKNGVIVITTKRGSTAGATITATSSVRWSSPFVLPDFQNEFAQGSVGGYSSTSLNGWGPRIAGQQAQNIRGEDITLQPFPNNVRDFYENGRLAINSVSLASANEQADFRLSATQQNQDGIVPNSNLGRTSLNLNTGYKVRPNVTARLTGTYVTTNTKGEAVQGGNDPNVLTGIVNFIPRTFDINDLRNYKDEDGVQRSLDKFTNNPYWVTNENVFTSGVERVLGSGSVEYSPVDWITLTGRTGLDYYTEDRRNINAVGTVGREKGLFSLDVLQRRELNVDLFGEAQRQVSDAFNIRALAGFNANGITNDIQRNQAQNLTVAGLYNFANALSNSPANTFTERHLYGIYGDVTLGYNDYLFLDVTGRNDWSSTLPVNNRSFFYPSANLSFVFSDAFHMDSPVLSFGKLRANIAQVGSDEDPYQLDFLFSPVSSIFGQYGTNNTFPFGGQVGFNATSTIPPTNLKPQTKTSWELGTELDFFAGRAGLDFTYYDESTTDQIISVPIPQSTGFAFNRTNIGEVQNRGVELQANVVPVRNGLFSWESVVNFSKNRNKVVSLAPGLDRLSVASAYNGLQVMAEPGKSLGLYGTGFLRNSAGDLVIDSNTGLRLAGGVVRLGDIDPDFLMSLDNRFRIGRASLNFLIAWRQGGNVFSSTVQGLRNSGLAAETAVNRDGTFVDEGVNVASVSGADSTFVPNTVPVSSMQAFWQQYASSTISEGSIFDATNVRLRELNLNYDLPTGWLGRLPVSGLTIGVEGRNLLMFYKKVPHIDPEVGLFGSASNGAGIEQAVLPTTRSVGLNFQLKL
jgi:TonB-linked SusC/RagA family outer membrane protein